MKFKEFSKWCNKRCSDGCWGPREAMTCMRIGENVYDTPFFKRMKRWKELEPIAVEIVNATNEKIKEVLGNENR